ncbi:hypothetical protein AB0J52_06730 [Spirillospora sp. NPDC049652]
MLTTQTLYHDDGSERAIRLQLRQDDPEATWRTTITGVLDGPDAALVSVGLEVFPNPGHQPNPGTPRLIRELVDALAPFDGPAPLTLHPQPVDAAGVEGLVDAR